MALLSPTAFAALSVTFISIIVALFVRARRRSAAASESDSSDEESISVNVVSEQDEQDSLLPSLSGLLRSPWYSNNDLKKAQTKMRPVRKGSRTMSLSLPMPLPLRKKRKQEVPTKKHHVPYFFPLLDETAEWWQAQQEPQPPLEPEGRQSDINDVQTCHKEELSTSRCTPNEMQQSEPPDLFAPAIASPSIEVGGH
ncbi:hypothetical protein PHYBOEH_010562 [Phytophthora boehmeriae]|uniref:Uncharacterized protein n=1 Tax=Phytophthora boehmeriae TaxID=109152 RepID=A0A8T1WZL7_9STRA|nr:hypothetical protein PHYBOEH_010562 [Phytophthora boehmeriae]